MMLEPDLDLGRRFVAAHPPVGRILLCAVTGSHHYGFPSPDSDIDLKGIHLAPTASLLGLEYPVETHDLIEISEGMECDFTSHEARKALKLLIGGNGNVLERILSPYQLYPSAELSELQQLAKDSLSKRFAKHYGGYFAGRCAEHAKSVPPQAKTLLYSYRVALTGIHLLQTGLLEANITKTAPAYGFEAILELVEFKRSHGEKDPLPADLDQTLRAGWPALEQRFQQALANSHLPDVAPNQVEISEWLQKKRLTERLERLPSDVVSPTSQLRQRAV